MQSMCFVQIFERFLIFPTCDDGCSFGFLFISFPLVSLSSSCPLELVEFLVGLVRPSVLVFVVQFSFLGEGCSVLMEVWLAVGYVACFVPAFPALDFCPFLVMLFC